MAIRALSVQECDRFNAVRAMVARHADTAVEWFADDGNGVLGAIAYHHHDLDWSWIVLGRDHHGDFRALARDGGLPALDDARRRLVEKMSLALATSDGVLPSPPAGGKGE